MYADLDQNLVQNDAYSHYRWLVIAPPSMSHWWVMVART